MSERKMGSRVYGLDLQPFDKLMNNDDMYGIWMGIV